MKRVLQVLGGTNLGGAESRIMDLYRHMDRDRIQFDFYEEPYAIAIPKGDMEMYQALSGALEELKAEGKTIVFVTHGMGSVKRFVQEQYGFMKER